MASIVLESLIRSIGWPAEYQLTRKWRSGGGHLLLAIWKRDLAMRLRRIPRPTGQ